MKMKRALTTAHHPQADGQTEILNQTIEIALQAYVGPERNDWARMLGPIQLAYNSSINASTGYSPAFLLRGFEPRNSISIDHEIEHEIRRPGKGFESKAAEDWLDELGSHLFIGDSQTAKFSQGNVNYTKHMVIGNAILQQKISSSFAKAKLSL